MPKYDKQQKSKKLLQKKKKKKKRKRKRKRKKKEQIELCKKLYDLNNWVRLDWAYCYWKLKTENTVVK